ncbi:biotin--[acetyl-CoA-carboxylase] ligase [Parvibium lacunae]|uniref:Biotin--[acetyl-CoA-carboxylase] ligase n=1 Tax=Parvibium lacunae TaxID=1888893 RepID=A0A368L225_9BURK|nr:biotin--[acetyl-CoA-carboxylase] ligase [Parvibium lacunae]RCS57162.1 biotin--[acetyl-CoA-carboxylase] ligase [Parvibium lacunae]
MSTPTSISSEPTAVIVNPLDALHLRAQMQALDAGLAAQLALSVVATTGSTNEDLLAQTRPAAPLTWAARLAESQTAGRGRRGKTWLAAPGHSLTLSLAWYQAPALERLSGLALVIGLAVREVLREEGLDCQLKWPNDIWLQQQKVGGILLETTGSASAPIVVIGLGLNLHLPTAFKAAIPQAITALDEWIIVPERNALAARLMIRIMAYAERFAATGFTAFQADYAAADALMGQAVWLRGSTDQPAWALGVDEQGQLQVSDAPPGDPRGTLSVVNAGEVSLRLRGQA